MKPIVGLLTLSILAFAAACVSTPDPETEFGEGAPPPTATSQHTAAPSPTATPQSHAYAIFHGNTTSAHAYVISHGDATAHAYVVSHGNASAHAYAISHGNTTSRAADFGQRGADRPLQRHRRGFVGSQRKLAERSTCRRIGRRDHERRRPGDRATPLPQ